MVALDGLAIAGRETPHEPATRQPRPSLGAMDWDDVRVFLAVTREPVLAGRACLTASRLRSHLGSHARSILVRIGLISGHFYVLEVRW